MAWGRPQHAICLDMHAPQIGVRMRYRSHDHISSRYVGYSTCKTFYRGLSHAPNAPRACLSCVSLFFCLCHFCRGETGEQEPAIIDVLGRTPALAQAVSRLLPFLTYGRKAAAGLLADEFAQVVRWEDVVADAASDAISSELPPMSPDQLRRRCFMAAAEGMGSGRSANVVRECLLKNGEGRALLAFSRRTCCVVGRENTAWRQFLHKRGLAR